MRRIIETRQPQSSTSSVVETLHGVGKDLTLRSGHRYSSSGGSNQRDVMRELETEMQRGGFPQHHQQIQRGLAFPDMGQEMRSMMSMMGSHNAPPFSSMRRMR